MKKEGLQEGEEAWPCLLPGSGNLMDLSGCLELLLPQGCGLYVVGLARGSFLSISLGTLSPHLDLATPFS